MFETRWHCGGNDGACQRPALHGGECQKPALRATATEEERRNLEAALDGWRAFRGLKTAGGAR